MQAEIQQTAQTQQQKQAEQLQKRINAEKKAAARQRVIKNLLRNKREQDSDDALQIMLQEDKELLVGYSHHKFGSFCLQASDLPKAEQHFVKAKELLGKRFVFSNVQMNLGNLYAQKKDYKKAIEHYEQVLKISPHSNPKQWADKDQVVFSSKLNSFNAYVDAHTNLAVMYVQLDQFQKGFQYCRQSLQLKPDQTQAIVNFTDIMRQLGKKQQAIKLTWENIVQHTRKRVDPDYEGFKALQIKSWTPLPEGEQYKKQKKINILSVKWGTRYPPEYVNKLYASIKRNTSWDITFYCFTDDGAGLNENIKIQKLEEGWKKWWGKVTLFNFDVIGKKFYIDLDMIITGNLDRLFQYEGEFTTLRTGDLACQKNHKDGYNSSVMIWQGDILKPVYNALKQNFQVINKFIVRFDFWLQMTINNADYVQKIYPGKVIDFLADAQKSLPQGSAVVCFARKPKPEDYPQGADWIREHWIE